MERKFAATDDVSTIALEAAVLEWVLLMARRPIRKAVGRASEWLLRIEQRFMDDWRHTPSMAALAAEANVDPSHLARTFRMHFGCSMGDYLRRRRVAWAANELATTDESIAAIARCAGFYDQRTFTRAFVHATGQRPGDYRRRWRRGLTI